MSEKDFGVWTVHDNIDMKDQGDKELLHNWKSRYSIDQLKKYAYDRDYSAFTIGAGLLPFPFAAMK